METRVHTLQRSLSHISSSQIPYPVFYDLLLLKIPADELTTRKLHSPLYFLSLNVTFNHAVIIIR